MTGECKFCGARIREENDAWVHENGESYCDVADGYRAAPKRKLHPIRRARLNAKYCLVRFSYPQAKQLFLAADNSSNRNLTELQRTALMEALDKLEDTAERWPGGRYG